jgi:hypothetical protein
MVDICSAHLESEVTRFVNLTDLSAPAPAPSSPNDLAFCAGYLYVTDLTGGYVWQIDGTETDLQPAVNIFAQFGAEARPNGIECLENSQLLISLSGTNRLVRLPAAPQEQPVSVQDVQITPVGLLRKGDGIKLDPSQELLYVALHSENTVLALASCDNWETAFVATSFLANCLSSTSSREVTTLVLAGADLWVLCSDGFGAGPYGLSRGVNISQGQVYTGQSACGFDEISSDDDGANSRDNDNNDKGNAWRVSMWITVVLGSFSCLAIVSWYLVKVIRDSKEKESNRLNEHILGPESLAF